MARMMVAHFHHSTKGVPLQVVDLSQVARRPSALTQGPTHPIIWLGIARSHPDQWTWIPHLSATNGHQSFWTDSTRLCLRPLGDVTVVLSKQGRNLGSKHTKILVTHLAELTPRQVVLAYQKRWPVELIKRELKSDLGLAEH